MKMPQINPAKAMQQAMIKMRSSLNSLYDKMEKQRIEGSAADGHVMVVLDGRAKIVAVSIGEDMIKSAAAGNTAALEAALVAAGTQAFDAAVTLQRAETGKLTQGTMPSGFPLPLAKDA